MGGPKNLKEDRLGFSKLQFAVKYQKIWRGPFGDKNKFEKVA